MTIAEQIKRAKADLDNVFADGKQKGEDAAYNRFWDLYQREGTRKNYKMGFSGGGWTKETFKPKYDIIATSAVSIFQMSSINASLSEILKENGVTLTVPTTSMENAFVDSAFTEITIDTSTATSMVNTFLQARNLTTLNLVLPTAESVAWYDTFYACTSLVNLKLTGKIYSRKYDSTGYAISLAWSKNLSKESIINVIECLDESVTGQLITFSLTAVNNAFETSEGAKDGSTSSEWTTLVESRPNWTINLLDK